MIYKISTLIETEGISFNKFDIIPCITHTSILPLVYLPTSWTTHAVDCTNYHIYLFFVCLFASRFHYL